MSAVVREAAAQDLEGVVAAHMGAFPGFFLTLLGPAFLRRLYRGFATERDVATLLVVDEAGHIAGFLAGCGAPEQFFRSMRRKHGLSMTCVALPSLLRHPLRVTERLLAAVRYRGDAPAGLPGYWLLSSLGVAEGRGGKGTGERLVRHFCELAASRGAEGVYLLTDADANDRVLHFYEKCGFRRHGLLVRRDGRRLAVIIRSFRP